MHNKKINTNKSQNFIQGLRPISSTVPHGFKKLVKKNGYNFSTIVDNWTKILNKDLSLNCYPNRIKFDKNIENGLLVLNVIHGKELEVEYSKKEIIDKINAFFGYSCIKEIKLKLIKEKKQIINDTNKNIPQKKYQYKIQNIQDKNLKISLQKLLAAFGGKND